MRTTTKVSIDGKIRKMTDENYYEWYKLFQNAGATNRAEVAKYYVEEVAKKFGQKNKLQDVFEKIYNGAELNFNADSKYRTAKDFKLAERKNSYADEIISKETYIQRNLYKNSSLYKNMLGEIFGYEVTFVRTNRCAPVDLISYDFDGENLTLNLIELKACKAETIKSPAKDLLLRALFEVATYKAYFDKVLAYNDELANAIVKQIQEKSGKDKITIEKIKKASICLIVLAPDYIIAEKDNEIMQGFLKPEIRLLTISAARKFDKTATVGSEEKLFDIV